MSDALAQVKRHVGPGAVILHTRSYKKGGILGLGGRRVVEVTAADGQEVGRVRRRTPKPRANANAGAGPKGSLDKGTASAPGAADLIRRTYAAAKAEMVQQQTGGAQNASPHRQVSSVGSDVDQLAEEMRAVKRMVSRVMYQQDRRAADSASALDVPDKLFEHYLDLLEQELAEDLARHVVEQVTTAVQGSTTNDEEALAQAVLEEVAKLVPTDGEAGRIEPTQDGRPRTIAVIGPTGVGKTTTIAKLAANFKLKQKLDVSLITQDTYRIAAVDQLQTYANIIGVPLQVVTRPDEMVEAMHRFRQSNVVLIDTAGRSQRDDPKLDQLHSFIRAAAPHEVHLVLSATCTEKVLLDTIDRFNRIPTDHIIFTKLDEAVTYGVLLNVAQKVNKRLSYLTTGQEVPHQIEPSRSDRLAALVVGCEVVSGPASFDREDEGPEQGV